jgi:hypothetical protein
MSILLTPLNQLQSLANALFLSLSPSQSKPPPPPPISAFLAVDQQLAHALILAQSHQVKQRKIEALKEELLSLEREWRDIVEALEAGRIILRDSIVEGEERIKAIEHASKGTLSTPTLPLKNFTSLHSCRPLPRIVSLCTADKRLYLCPSQHAGRDLCRPTSPSALLSSFPQRGKDAERETQRRGTTWFVRRDAPSRNAYDRFFTFELFVILMHV